ncbi:tail tubular protein [Vibrio phage phiVC8]|uniref:Tail protein n=1 Tax=Vibrio phage phiVC8 TaxID=1076759 RepID=G3FFM3_BPVC8|nr:tail tubular protein [Vibrio phage phiVC8]AEM62911.1 tail protein [Vibrio phage phiVC8]
MPSLVSIYNKALAHVGAKSVLSENDSNTRAETCNAMYEFALRSALEAREWSFAAARVRLLPDPLITPSWGYNYGYRLPNNCIRVCQVRDGSMYNLDWAVEAGFLYATRPTVDVKYNRLIEDPNAFTPTFVEALCLKLASDICIPLTENRGLATDLVGRYLMLVSEGAALDGLQASRERLRADTLINARRGCGRMDRPYPQTGSGKFYDIAPPTIPDSPPVGNISGPSSVQLGQPFSFVAQVTGTQPISYQWYKNGIAIPSATSISFGVESATNNDEGEYYCLFSNSAGIVISNKISLEIGCFPPVHNITGPTTVGEGKSFSMTCMVTSGNLPVTYQWQRDGQNIVGATAATLSVAAAVVSDSGQYDCLVSNQCSSDVSSTNKITLDIIPLVVPTVSISPTSASPLEPAPVTFTAAIVDDGGAPPVTLKWYLNGSLVQNGGTTYTTPPTAVNQNRTVSVVGTNSVGDSAPAVASVTPVSNFISQSTFTTNATFTLHPDCTFVQVQGCGGGGGGGSGRTAGGNDSIGGGGGGGAALVSVLSSNAIGGQTATIVVGGGGGGAANRAIAAGNGGNSSVSGAGIVGLSWTGGKAGANGVQGYYHSGGNGGNNSSNTGAGAGALSGNAASGVNGGGGGGQGGGQGDWRSGNGGGSNAGLGTSNGNNAQAAGGGGGGNSAVWWDNASAGKGGDGTASSGASGGHATGNGNGGGGGAGGTPILGSGIDGSAGGNGSGGKMIIRQYRRPI